MRLRYCCNETVGHFMSYVITNPVPRGILSAEEVQSIKEEISSVVSRWYSNWTKTGVEGKDWMEIANRKPAWKEGRWKPSSEDDVELGFRRLYGLTRENKFFDRLSKHEKVLLFSVVGDLAKN